MWICYKGKLRFLLKLWDHLVRRKEQVGIIYILVVREAIQTDDRPQHITVY